MLHVPDVYSGLCAVHHWLQSLRWRCPLINFDIIWEKVPHKDKSMLIIMVEGACCTSIHSKLKCLVIKHTNLCKCPTLPVGLQYASDKWRSTWTSGHPSSCQALLVHHDLNQVYCIYLCVSEHSWLASSVSGRLMGLICPTALCVRQAPRPRWRTWVKEWIIDSDKALRALIAAGELDYLFKVPSLGKGESYQWSPDWPHIVLLWTCSGRAKKKRERERDACLWVHIYLGRIEIAQSLPVAACVCTRAHQTRPVSVMSSCHGDIFCECFSF